MRDSRAHYGGPLKQRVLDVIHGRGPDRTWFAAGLRTLAFLFEGVVRLRAQYHQRRRPRDGKLACRVVSIGNLSTGGTGKTPLCIYLARLIHDAGYRVVIISRGYRGAAEKSGAVIAPAEAFAADARQVGDEPALMARLLNPCAIPVMVGRDRLASGRSALARFKPDVMLLDDGFQHQRLVRDLDIVLLDGETPLGNGHLLPRGPLREPPSALRRADILVLTRCPAKTAGEPAAPAGRQLVQTVTGLADKPLYACRHRPVARERLDIHPSGGPRTRPLDLDTLANLPVLAFSGIARNDAFRQTLVELGADIRGWMSFRDHYRYGRGDLVRLVREGRRKGARALVTTDKDRVRIHDDWVQELPLLVIGVVIDFAGDRSAFERHVFDKLGLEKLREKCP